MTNIAFRKLTETDAAAICALRLSVLKSNPETFSVSIREENKGSIEALKAVISNYESAHDCAIFGAHDKELIGMLGIAPQGSHLGVVCCTRLSKSGSSNGITHPGYGICTDTPRSRKDRTGSYRCSQRRHSTLRTFWLPVDWYRIERSENQRSIHWRMQDGTALIC